MFRIVFLISFLLYSHFFHLRLRFSTERKPSDLKIKINVMKFETDTITIQSKFGNFCLKMSQRLLSFDQFVRDIDAIISFNTFFENCSFRFFCDFLPHLQPDVAYRFITVITFHNSNSIGTLYPVYSTMTLNSVFHLESEKETKKRIEHIKIG